ncbi:MAG: 3-phosphoshikimate 1-carboxyvinyltransferase [Candidatus Omnitrophica bacterium]|nr:3-phosphoshikimate 1-carboxyvinyltransferase [Candidatus Omnitrophota bacterium]
MNKVVSCKTNPILGRFVPPGDKSISHRALMFGALAKGTSRFSHFLEADDCLRTMKAFRDMGVSIEHGPGSGNVVVHGVGLQGLKKPVQELDFGNSGTSMRLMLGILAGQNFEATLIGDDSLSSRPMKRVTQPLKQMGAQIKGRDKGNFAPLSIRGGKLNGIRFENKLSSAQVKSAILLAGLFAEGETSVEELIASRDHTERFLESCGAIFQKSGTETKVQRTQELQSFQMEIPGDISSAAFFITGAAMIPGSELVVEKICLNPTRTGVLEVLKRMGAEIRIEQTQDKPEPLGRLEVKGKKLVGTRIVKQEIPSLIDELPILMTAMALAQGESLISGAEELRVKETDRIHSMVKNLTAVGGHIQELPDGCLIRGVEKFQGRKVQSLGDHRTAMSMAIATLAMEGALEIEDVDCVRTSFPDFFAEFDRLRGV